MAYTHSDVALLCVCECEFLARRTQHVSVVLWYCEQESLALASMARDDPPSSSTAAAMRGKVGSEFET